MPGLSYLLDSANDSGLDARPELFKMLLPSQLSFDNRESWCLPGLPTLEARFRYAQANDALAEIRRLRRLFQGLLDQSKKHITSSQHTITRTKGTFERYKVCISRFAELYRHARCALIILDPMGEITRWTSRLLELKDADIKGPGRDKHKTSEGRTVPSWIWNVSKTPQSCDTSIPNDASAATNNSKYANLSECAASGEEIALSIRAHWARCQARAERYEEEVQLTVEEMRRTLEFFRWKSRWWLSLQDARSNSTMAPDPQVVHGLRAYSHRQASMYSSLVHIYVEYWRTFLVENSLGYEWLALHPSNLRPSAGPGSNEPSGNSEDEDEDEVDLGEPADPEFEERFVDLPGS